MGLSSLVINGKNFPTVSEFSVSIGQLGSKRSYKSIKLVKPIWIEVVSAQRRLLNTYSISAIIILNWSSLVKLFLMLNHNCVIPLGQFYGEITCSSLATIIVLTES